METKELNTYWKEIEPYFELDPFVGSRMYAELMKAYTETGRWYHNDAHILTLLRHIDKQRLPVEGRITLMLVAFYHDVIYVPGSATNEEKSALLLEAHFEDVMCGKALIDKAAQIVRETRNHQTKDALSQLFMDMDLAILGADPEGYRKYCEQIRKEFRNIPEFIYRRGRKQFVRNTLQQPPIFQTDAYRSLYEMQAYENLSAELLEL